MQHSKSNQAHAKARVRRRRIFTGGVAVVGSAGLAAAVLLPAGTALAAYQAGPSPDGSSVASVTVGSAISLTDNTPTFSLGSNLPGDRILPTTPLTLKVYTNNLTGYNVTVQAATDLSDTANTADTIPASDLSVEDLAATDPNTATDNAGFVPITAATDAAAPAPLVVYNQVTRSAIGTVDPSGVITGGDTLHETWDFNTTIPDVNTGTYSTTIDFIATANPTGT